MTLAVFLSAGLFAESSEAKPGKFKNMSVMTRNLYLGSDLTPGLAAGSLAELTQGAGLIYRNVEDGDPATRMEQIAREIRSQNPDLVGLQEVALWRKNETPVVYIPGLNTPSSSTENYDFLELLLSSLNQGQPKAKQYRTVISQNEFDFESPADIDDNDLTCDPGSWGIGGTEGCPTFPGADLTGRLTMRDVILAKGNVQILKKFKGTFAAINTYTPMLAGAVQVPVTRGFTAVHAKLKGNKPFRFINTHLEAFGDPEGPRCGQAGELYNRAVKRSPLPVLLVGDINSDDDTVDGNSATPELDGSGEERCAYLSLKNKGLVSLTSGADASCCTPDSLDDADVTKFDSQIDHILTNKPKRFKASGNSVVTGATPFRINLAPFYGSDHAGVFQRLRFR